MRFFGSVSIITSLLVFGTHYEALPQAQAGIKPDAYVVMLSIDGFRWDYPQMYNTPNLNRVAREGVKARSLIPCYPSKTFPNHYSIATGLYPDNHGIVNNSFYDSKLGFYSIGDREAVENGKFYGGEPIWVTAEKQGVRAASFYWVGSEAPVQGIQPTYWKKYKQKVPFAERIDTVIRWLSLPESKRPRLITWYFHEPDGVSHRYGPESNETKRVVEEIDSLLGVFFQKAESLPIYSRINFIILSDHGMASISPERFVNLSEYLAKDWFTAFSGGNPMYSLQPKPEYWEKVLTILKGIPHLKTWERKDIPSRYVYGTNPRIFDILIEADLGYSVSWAGDKDQYDGGTHGYDNMYPEMQGIFYAMGPAFKKGYSQPSFLNVNIYPLVAQILNLKPAKVDGELSEVSGLLK
jgi:alkaline phosphatase D